MLAEVFRVRCLPETERIVAMAYLQGSPCIVAACLADRGAPSLARSLESVARELGEHLARETLSRFAAAGGDRSGPDGTGGRRS